MKAYIKGYAEVGPEDKQLSVVFEQDTQQGEDWLPHEIKYDGALVTLDYLEETLGVPTAHSAIDRALDHAWNKL